MDPDTILARLKPVLGEEADELWRALQVADPATRRLLEADIRLRAERMLGLSFREGQVLLEPIPPDQAGGAFPLGQVFYGFRPLHAFGLRPGELIQHAALFGRSGAGKTNVALLLLQRLAKQGIPFLVFDWKKNYRDLLPQPAFRRLVVYTVGRDAAPFFFNPLIPPAGVEPKEWLKKLTEIMQHAYFLGEGVAFVLQEVLDQLYRRFSVYDSPGSWPTCRENFLALPDAPRGAGGRPGADRSPPKLLTLAVTMAAVAARWLAGEEPSPVPAAESAPPRSCGSGIAAPGPTDDPTTKPASGRPSPPSHLASSRELGRPRG